MQRNPISCAIAAYRSLSLINVSDTWLCFLLSVILTVKQNDCVKDTKIFVRSLFQAIRLWLGKIKIATVKYPPASQKNSAGHLTAPLPPPPPPPPKKKKTCKGSGRWKKNPYKLKKFPSPPSITSVAVKDGIQTFRLGPSTQYSV